ncbi:MAG: hypothetical protein ACTHZ9_09245 [Leucobacter sp.]|uniref:hypothetical protein n=1 Tax=Leucobacter TaxID=55968 RepID=UPI0037CA41C0
MLWSIGEWVDFSATPSLLDWSAFLLGGLGIGFTIFQLMRSKGALVAARKELERTRTTLIKNQLLSVLPGFEELMASIDDAVRVGDRQELSSQLQRFAYRAAEAAALLEASSSGFSDLIERINGEARNALEARSRLYGSPDTQLEELVRASVDELQVLVMDVKGIAVSIRNDPGKVPADKEGKNA